MMRPGLLPVVGLCLLLAGCDSRERATRNEVYQLAYRSAQLQAALEVCAPDAETTAKHAAAWQETLDEAEGWIGIGRDQIEARPAAGREALESSGGVPCNLLSDLRRRSVQAARAWGDRIAERRLCGWMRCDPED
ncbi:MAG: hypothetical protein KIT73_06495 [Burkholderiales bacterium]|nr:hypothetical protein [Burkholderiales bacterium]